MSTILENRSKVFSFGPKHVDSQVHNAWAKENIFFLDLLKDSVIP